MPTATPMVINRLHPVLTSHTAYGKHGIQIDLPLSGITVEKFESGSYCELLYSSGCFRTL